MSNATKSVICKLGILVVLCLISFAALSLSSSVLEAGDPVGKVSGKKLKEASGLVASGRRAGVLWTHNDGNAKRLYALDTKGTIVGSVSLKDLPIDDLEDIALGPGPAASVPHLYLGDLGDNDGDRDAVRVLRFPEPELTGDGKIEPSGVVTFSLRYPDGSHDAEALLIDPLTGDLFVATKGEEARVYTVSSRELRPEGVTTMKFIGVLPCEKVSGGDISADGRKIVMRSETEAWLWLRKPAGTVSEALAQTALPLPVVGPPEEPNGEAIAIDPSSHGYYTLSEGEEETIYHFANVLRQRSPS